MINRAKPLVVQSDGTLLLEVQHPDAQSLRLKLSAIAHLEKSPEYFHEYRLTPISLWNAAQAGWTRAQVLALLEENARYPVPMALSKKIEQALDSFGRIELVREGEALVLRAVRAGDKILDELSERSAIQELLGERRKDKAFIIDPAMRGA